MQVFSEWSTQKLIIQHIAEGIHISKDIWA